MEEPAAPAVSDVFIFVSEESSGDSAALSCSGEVLSENSAAAFFSSESGDRSSS